MANANRYSSIDRWGAGVFVWFVLHWIPLPCPVRWPKSPFPPEYWDSLGFFDAPWEFAYMLFIVVLAPHEIRDLGWVMLFYEPLLLALTLAILYRFPHWLIGRD